jgi:hypothetical protein
MWCSHVCNSDSECLIAYKITAISTCMCTRKLLFSYDFFTKRDWTSNFVKIYICRCTAYVHCFKFWKTPKYTFLGYFHDSTIVCTAYFFLFLSLSKDQ